MNGSPSPRVRSFEAGGCEIRITDRSLAALGEPVDAVVSSDDNYLSHGGGVSYALWQGAGEDDIAASLANRPEKWALGDIVVTAAGALDARAILHAVTLDFDLGRALTHSELADLYGRVFLRAEQSGHTSLGLPLLASGAGRIAPQASVSLLARALQDFLAAPTAIRRIVVSAPGDRFPIASDGLESLEHWHASFEDLRTALARSLERAENSPSWLAGLATALESAAAPEWASLTAFLLDQAQASMSQASAPADFLRRAQALRNRLAHGVGQPRWTADVTATWLDLLEHLHASREQQSDRNALADTEDAPASLSTVWLNVAAQNRREIAPARGPLFEEPAASVECRVDGARPLARHSTVSEEVRSTEPEGSHVRRLHQLLLEQLAGNEILKSSVDRMLTGRGYQGDFELRLLEHCIRIEEPANLLSGIFDLSRLHAMHTQVVGQPADNASGSIELAREILSALGFPEPSECRGPKQVREFVERSEQLVRIKGLPVASAVVHDVARQLEYLCHVLLRFMCQAAFGESPELHLKNRGSIKKPGDLAKSGLGALLIFTEQVIDDLRTAKDPKALVLQRDLGEGALPAGKDALSSVRNSFSHFKPGAPVASEADALAFLQQASQLCTALAKPNSRLLPYVIAIQSLEIDRWGRRTVRALNDEGMDETIFTDEPVRPGEMYLMYPLSNPLRVDPILVPAGDVIWKD